MTAQRFEQSDLHGNVPDVSRAVLLLVDVLNDLRFPNNGEILRECARLGRTIARLKQRCRVAGIPSIYVNDNRGKWRSDLNTLVSACARKSCPGWPLAAPLLPDACDYVVLKPKHSAFYATALDAILAAVKARLVILVGLTTSSCILLTAGEIYVRDLKLYVPSDCVAGLRRQDHAMALELMRRNFNAVTTRSSRLELKTLKRSAQ